jgi:glycosyltransferase involved in cell wall biosynthesis
MNKKKILICTPKYLPGFKGGGPIQSIANLADVLKKTFDVYIYTSDRDLGDSKPYNNVFINTWNDFNGYKVFYASIEKNKMQIIKIIKKGNFDIVYLNSFFSFWFSIIIVIAACFKMIKTKMIVIAPRGELSDGAFNIKRYKKKLYLIFFKWCYMSSYIKWHATSIDEMNYIRKRINKYVEIVISRNITLDRSNGSLSIETYKSKGLLKVIFVSRIVKKKNLIGALKVLKKVNKNVIFDIYGPIEDKEYWNDCIEVIKNMPKNIIVSYKGILDQKRVYCTFKNYDLFLFPTFSENYGHVIIESLNAGCPVIISDQTPWHNLRSHQAGWNIPVNDHIYMSKIIEELCDMDEIDYKKFREGAHKLSLEIINDKSNIENIMKIFNY